MYCRVPQFVYLKEAFSPALEERIAVLHEAFGVDGRLVVNYALTPAWG
jgi:ubiquitin-like protein ATG12